MQWDVERGTLRFSRHCAYSKPKISPKPAVGLQGCQISGPRLVFEDWVKCLRMESMSITFIMGLMH